MTVYQASGLKYSPATCDWTDPVKYTARNEMEAIRWCNMNRDWFKNLHVTEINLGSGNFYTI